MQIPSINKSLGKAMNWATKNKFIAKELEKGFKEPTKYAAKIMMYSIVSKDFINTIIYTYQSYNNKEIPEGKRKFISAMDLVNGFINVFGQILSFKLIDHGLTPRIESLYTGIFKDGKTGTEETVRTKATLAPDNINALTKKAINKHQAEFEAALKSNGETLERAMKNLPHISDAVIKKTGHSSPIGKDLATGLGLIIAALATMALVKRTITPLVSTPIAGWLSTKWEIKEKAKKEHKLDIKEFETVYKKHKNGDDKRPIISGFNSK